MFKHNRTIEQFITSVGYLALKNFCSEIFLRIVIKASVAEFISSNILCFQYILLNTFRWISLRIMYENYCLRRWISLRIVYENYSLRRILFQTFNQHSHCKSLTAEILDGIRIKMKTASPI